MKCNVANEKIIKPALPSLLRSHCIALFKARGCSNSSVGYDFGQRSAVSDDDGHVF